MRILIPPRLRNNEMKWKIGDTVRIQDHSEHHGGIGKIVAFGEGEHQGLVYVERGDGSAWPCYPDEITEYSGIV